MTLPKLFGHVYHASVERLAISELVIMATDSIIHALVLLQSSVLVAKAYASTRMNNTQGCADDQITNGCECEFVTYSFAMLMSEEPKRRANVFTGLVHNFL